MKILALLFLCLAASMVANGNPGNEVPYDFPEFTSLATVERTVLTEDGEVFLQGDFTEVNGIPRPGLAKLKADGTLDEISLRSLIFREMILRRFRNSSKRTKCSYCKMMIA